MQIVTFAVAAAILFAFSGKKKTKSISKTPQIEKIGRVERLLNSAAVAQSLSSQTPPPSIMYAYISKDAALERMTTVMRVQADMFLDVEFYQMPISAIKEAIQAEGSPPKGVSGNLVGVHPDGVIWAAYIYPNDDVKDIATKVAQRIYFAMTGNRPNIKEW